MPPVAGRPPTKPMIEFEDDCFSRLHDKSEGDCKRCLVSKQCETEMGKDHENEEEKKTEQETTPSAGEEDTDAGEEDENNSSGGEKDSGKQEKEVLDKDTPAETQETSEENTEQAEKKTDSGKEEKMKEESDKAAVPEEEKKKEEPMKKVEELAKASKPKSKKELPPTSSANPFRNATGGWAAYEAIAKIHGKFTSEEAVTQFHMFCKENKVKVEDPKGRMSKTLATLVQSKLVVKDKDGKYEMVKDGQ